MMDLAGVAADRPDVRLLTIKMPVTLNLRPDGAINNVFFGRPSFDVPAGLSNDDDDVSNDDDDVDVDESRDGDDDQGSKMDTDEASNFDDANATEEEIENDNDPGYDSDDSVKFLFEVINLD